MAVCAFCGHDNREGARSCVACGFVFDTEPSPPPTESPPTEPAPGAPTSLAALFDPAEIEKPARQALVVIGLAAALAMATAAHVILDAGNALDELGNSTLVLDPPEITPRTDLLALAELSVLAGCLVMLGGWSQQVAAHRALLDTPAPRHTPRWALTAWLIPVANVWLPGVLIRELWEDSTPPGDRAPPGFVVRVWPALLAIALVGRYAALLFGFLASRELETRAEVTVVSGLLVIPLLLWVGALGATAVVVRALTARQRARALALAPG